MTDWSDHRIDTILAVRLDSLGDVLLTGPALRALARRARVVLAVGPAGEAAAALLPGVADLVRFDCPWIVADPEPVDPDAIDVFVRAVRRHRIRHAVIFTSDRQSALPTALVLRMAGVDHIAAFSEHYPGSLLDVRVKRDPDLHEVERNLHLVGLLGFDIDRDRRLAVCRRPLPNRIASLLPERYVVVHAGATAPARTLTPERWTSVVEALLDDGHEVVLTGGADDSGAADVAHHCPRAVNLLGRTTFEQLGSVIARSEAICVGNTGAMHLAAAVGTPTVATFPPTVPVHRWRPWSVPHVLLGMHDIGCALCHLRECPIERHPCAAIEPGTVVEAVGRLLRDAGAPRRQLLRGTIVKELTA